jgi:hypothetical protein
MIYNDQPAELPKVSGDGGLEDQYPPEECHICGWPYGLSQDAEGNLVCQDCRLGIARKTQEDLVVGKGSLPF